MSFVRRVERPAQQWWLAALCVLGSTTLGSCASQPPPADQQIVDEIGAMRVAISQTIVDPQRAARLQKAVNGMQTELLDFESLYSRFGADLRVLNANPQVSRLEFEAMFDRFDTERRGIRGRLLAYHLELLSASTESEWAVLSPHEQEALRAMRRGRGS